MKYQKNRRRTNNTKPVQNRTHKHLQSSFRQSLTLHNSLPTKRIEKLKICSKLQILKGLHRRKQHFRRRIPSKILQFVKCHQQICAKPSQDLHYSYMLSFECLRISESKYIVGQICSDKLRFLFYDLNRPDEESRSILIENLTMVNSIKLFPNKNTESFACICVCLTERKIIGMNVTYIPSEQKMKFAYSVSLEIQQYLIINARVLAIVYKNGQLNMGSFGQQLQTPKKIRNDYISDAQQVEGRLMILTKSFVIKLLDEKGQLLKVIRTGICISTIRPIQISQDSYQIFCVQEEKLCLISASSTNSITRFDNFQINSILSAKTIGKFILIESQSHTVYALALQTHRLKNDKTIYQIGENEGFLSFFQVFTGKALHQA